MAHKTLFTCSDLYAQGTGAKWDNLVYARTGDGHGAYTHIKGSKSKSEYKPKDLCYIYKYKGLDPNKQKVGKVYWTVVFRKYNLKKNGFPKLRIYSGKKGDNTFIREVTTYKRLKNTIELDNYTIQYDLGNLTIAQLKSLIVKVVWDKTKSKQASEISINRARLYIGYSPLRPKFSLFATPNDASITNNDEFIWTLTAKNTGDCGSAESTLVLPTGVTILSSNGDGSYDNSTMKWSYKLCNGKSATRNFRLKFSYVDRYTIRATNDSTYAVNGGVETTVNVEQYYPSPQGELITYTFYPCFAFEDGYFDINIYGVYNGQERHYYDITIPNGITVTYPLKNSMIDLGNNSNVLSFPKTGFNKTNRICVQVNDTMSNFEAHIRIPYHSSSEADYTVTTRSVDSAKDYNGTLHILEKRGMKLLTAPTITRDKGYVGNSVNIGSPNVWTIRAKASQKNFFDERKDYMSIDIERMIAYIGVIPLSRCHKADVTATSKNSLIENRYLNRAYYGKKGDYDEDIKMTLRMKWQDVATLQGLCEMDKPIPIDTIPTRADGDPLNHRGWAEIYEVSNIKKINDLYYECDVGVKYLTHKLLTKFGISEKGKITASAIKYYLALTHDYTDDMLNLFRPNYYQNFTSLEDVNGNSVGSYELDAPTTLTLSSIENVNKYSTWDIIFRNHLPSLMSEDFDGNWEMSLRISNHENGESLFEHTYNNFQHYDFDRSVAINSADVTSTFKNGNVYETLNYDKVGLGYDNFSELLEVGKVATHFNTMETTILNTLNDQFEIFLLDKDNKGLVNQVVKVNVDGDNGFKNSFKVMTDIYGRVLFEVNWGNGYYSLQLTYDGNDDYGSCSYSTDLNVNFDYVECTFEYPNNLSVWDLDYPYVVTLLNGDTPCSGFMLHYSFRTASGSYGYERTVMTDANGQAVIPIDWVNGSIMIRVRLDGFTSGGVTYQPVMMEEVVNVNVS